MDIRLVSRKVCERDREKRKRRTRKGGVFPDSETDERKRVN